MYPVFRKTNNAPAMPPPNRIVIRMRMSIWVRPNLTSRTDNVNRPIHSATLTATTIPKVHNKAIPRMASVSSFLFFFRAGTTSKSEM